VKLCLSQKEESTDNIDNYPLVATVKGRGQSITPRENTAHLGEHGAAVSYCCSMQSVCEHLEATDELKACFLTCSHLCNASDEIQYTGGVSNNGQFVITTQHERSRNMVKGGSLHGVVLS
jgi:hypothetical protein